MSEQYQRRRGDRRDGRLLRELDSLHYITGIIYPNRCDNEAYIGLRVDLYKYAAILLGAVGCALAGMNLALDRLGLFTNSMVAARGFIALAAIYCGRGKPVQSSLYAILFGLSRSLAVNLSVYAGEASGLFDCFPYLLMIVVLGAASYVKYKNVKVRGFQV